MSNNQLIDALAKAIMRGEKIFLNHEAKELYNNLPTPQKVGTYTQRMSYARDKAVEILNHTPPPSFEVSLHEEVSYLREAIHDVLKVLNDSMDVEPQYYGEVLDEVTTKLKRLV